MPPPPAAIRHGVTLIEMMIVVTIIGVMAGISFPAVSSGLDSIRLHSAADSVAAFLNSAMNRAQRRQEVVEVVVDPKENRLSLYSTVPGFARTLELPHGITLTGETVRSVMLIPAASFPRFAVEISNERGSRKSIFMDPITGTPQISNVDTAQQ